MEFINNVGELSVEILELAVAVLDSFATAGVGISDGDGVGDLVVLDLVAGNLELIWHNNIANTRL